MNQQASKHGPKGANDYAAGDDDGAAEPTATWFDTSLIGVENRPIRRLSGFVRGRHHLPKSADPGSDAFVAELAQPEREHEITELHRNLRQHFGLRRRQLVCDGDSLRCPAFQYFLSVQVDPEDPKRAQFWRELSEIRDPQWLLHPSFAAIFGDHFDRVQVRHRGQLDLETIIDQFEECGVNIDYPPNLDYASLILPRFRCQLRIEARSVTMTSLAAAEEISLVEQFMAATLDLEGRGITILPRPAESA